MLFTIAAAVLTIVASPTIATADPPTGRAFELATPRDKGDSDVIAFARAAGSGGAIAFQSFGSFAGSAAPSGNQNTYLTRRTPAGWQTVSLSPAGRVDPPGSYGSIRGNPFFSFSSDLGKAAFSNFSPPALTASDPAEARNLYVRDTHSGANTLITTLPPIDLSGNLTDRIEAPRVAWASPDLQHVLFDTPQASDHWHAGAIYFPGSPTDTYGQFSGVYHWSPSAGMSLASILPGGSVAGSAAAGSGPTIPAYDDDLIFVDNYGGGHRAISDDGSRIFFTSPHHGTTAKPSGQLFVRKDHGQPGATTVKVSASQIGGTERPAWYRAATPDGSKVLFTTCAPLTSDSTASQDGAAGGNCQPGKPGSENAWEPNNNALYLFDVEANGGAGELTDLTANVTGGPRVRGVVGTSDDLSRVYFVAESVLASGAINERPNLYLWDEQDGFTFIAALNRGNRYGTPDFSDGDNWRPVGDQRRDARVSSDGRFVAFTSHAWIDDNYDNRDPETGERMKQVYFWQIGDAKPKCLSCAGTGRPTLGSIANQRMNATEVYLAVEADWEKQNLLPDGRLFFETGNNLVAEDVNSQPDVYEYNPATGKLTLFSDGRGSTPTSFAGASLDGRDVYIRTANPLSTSDVDGSADIYDVRLGGGDLPEQSEPGPTCAEGTCEDLATTHPQDPGQIEPAPVLFGLAKINAKQRQAFARRGILRLGVNVPGAGRVIVVGRGKLAGKQRRVARGSARAKGQGRVVVPVRLTKPARRALKRGARLNVRLVVRFGKQQRNRRVVLRDVSAKKVKNVKRGG